MRRQLSPRWRTEVKLSAEAEQPSGGNLRIQQPLELRSGVAAAAETRRRTGDAARFPSA
jgi:hypothetical protein